MSNLSTSIFLLPVLDFSDARDVVLHRARLCIEEVPVKKNGFSE